MSQIDNLTASMNAETDQIVAATAEVMWQEYHATTPVVESVSKLNFAAVRELGATEFALVVTLARIGLATVMNRMTYDFNAEFGNGTENH